MGNNFTLIFRFLRDLFSKWLRQFSHIVDALPSFLHLPVSVHFSMIWGEIALTHNPIILRALTQLSSNFVQVQERASGIHWLCLKLLYRASYRAAKAVPF
jgi:hypothetical protein